MHVVTVLTSYIAIYILTVMCECSYVLRNKVIWRAKYLVCILHVRMQIHNFMFILAMIK